MPSWIVSFDIGYEGKQEWLHKSQAQFFSLLWIWVAGKASTNLGTAPLYLTFTWPLHNLSSLEVRDDPELDNLLSEYADNIELDNHFYFKTHVTFILRTREILTYKYKRPILVLTANAVIPSLLEIIKQVLFSAFTLGPSASWIVI